MSQSANAFDSKEETGPRSVGQICAGIVAKLTRHPKRRRLHLVTPVHDPVSDRELICSLVADLPAAQLKAVIVRLAVFNRIDRTTAIELIQELGLREV